MKQWMALGLAFAMACGGEDTAEEETTATTTSTTTGSERPVERNDGVGVEGLMGTISAMAVQRALEPRIGRFFSCFNQRSGDVEVLGGRIVLSFRIRTDGSVLWVFPRESTIGDRATERCMLDVAASTQFSRPQGGEAEFTYPLEVDPPEDVRPPTFWDSSRVMTNVERVRGEIVDCGNGPFHVTAYVAPGGRVIAAGASTSEQTQSDALDCVAEAVSGWSMPDPGSYPAKVSFDL
ncbi:MAG: AgmX/PglI C-terminal domain-containing protein [Sandaracinus sp.]|nr:AgmX/PglI C-terminal domain-containing protein [Sandaracinus sp.]MCB9620577.1 AgmX/PglI C-terminal domain-containing protein [Sandaracinus sp.]MCB9636566.1 AgmX/PglI C-terminal domain-containing protein [Sandaracinus sp.]